MEMATLIAPPSEKLASISMKTLTINKVSQEQREKELLLNPEWPFPCEGSIVKQEDGAREEVATHFPSS